MRRAFCFWFLVLIAFPQASQRSSVRAADAVLPLSSHSESLSQHDKSWSRTAAVLSDFDGDGTPDLAVGTFDGQNYNIEIRLSTHLASTFLASGQTGRGTFLLVRDIDADNDEDLVLINYTSLVPLAVWLNDGKANFRPGSRWSWLNLTTTDSAPSVDPGSFSASPVSLTTNYRLVLDPCVTGFRAPKLQPQSSVAYESWALRSLLFPSHPSLRGPPINS